MKNKERKCTNNEEKEEIELERDSLKKKSRKKHEENRILKYNLQKGNIFKFNFLILKSVNDFGKAIIATWNKIKKKRTTKGLKAAENAISNRENDTGINSLITFKSSDTEINTIIFDFGLESDENGDHEGENNMRIREWRYTLILVSYISINILSGIRWVFILIFNNNNINIIQVHNTVRAILISNINISTINDREIFILGLCKNKKIYILILNSKINVLIDTKGTFRLVLFISFHIISVNIRGAF